MIEMTKIEDGVLKDRAKFNFRSNQDFIKKENLKGTNLREYLLYKKFSAFLWVNSPGFLSRLA